MAKDKMDYYREKVENVLYDAAIFMSAQRDLNHAAIRDNFNISIEAVIEMLDIQYPELSDNGETHDG